MRFCQRSRSCGIGTQQGHRQQDQVIEIDRVVDAQCTLVGAVQRGMKGLDVVVGLVQRGVGFDQVVLPRRDLPARAPQRVFVGLVLLRQFAQQLLDILLVEDAEARAQPGRLEFAAQDVQAEGVKGRDAQAAAGLGPSSLPTRPFISRAALLVKVTAVM